MPAEGHAQLRVLISGCLPPPVGGMAAYYQTLVESRLSEYICFRFVQTSTHKRELSSSGRATFSNLVSAICDGVRFTRALIKYNPKITHIGTASGLSFIKHSYCVFISRLFGCRVLLHPHCSLSVLYTDKSTIWQWFFRQVIHGTDGVLALSQEWLKLSTILPGCKVFYLPNPVDIELYHSVVAKNQSPVKTTGPLRILYLGYLGLAKGSFDIINAATLIRSRGVEMIFDLVGSELTPGELDLLQDRVGSANLEYYVRINPPAFHVEKQKFLSNADIFIYPSYHEGLPMAVLEAMACELPIIASRVGGLPDLVKDGINGVLIDPGKPDQLADALCNIANQFELLDLMGKMSYQFVNERFSIDQHLTQLVNIYKTVMISPTK